MKLSKMPKKLEAFLTKIEPPNWVLAVIGITAILRVPSLFEPYYYGDEMIYITLGNAIRKGITIYSQIHDNKPPLLYVMAAIAGNLIWFKAILLIWTLVTIAIFWHLTKELFEKNVKLQKVAVIVFALLTTIPLFEGNIANAENFLIGPIILGILILVKNGSVKNTFIAGIVFSIAFLFKVPAIFDVAVIPLLWVITSKNTNDFVKIIKKSLILALGFAIPIAFTFIYFYFKGALGDYIKAAFLQNVGYISTWSGQASESLFVKYGPLLIRAGIVLFGIILLRIKNQKLSKSFLIAAIWVLTSLFAGTLSGRPYPHYMLQAVPAISLLVAILVSSEKFEQVLAIIPLTLVVFVPFYYKFFYYSTSAYYVRFEQFATGQTSKWQYFNSFDKNMEGQYAVSNFLMKSVDPSKKIFVWGDSAPGVYALSRRLPSIKYTATYHIDSFTSRSEVLKELENKQPQFIVIPPNSPSWPELASFVSKKYILIYTNFNFAVWQLLTN